jgi:hypothetical protein
MKLISTLATAAAIVTASAFVPAGAITPARIDASQVTPVENVARVCREVCRAGVCRERCRWRPDGPRVRVYSDDGYRAYGYHHRHRYRDRGPSVEFNIR